LTNQAFYKASFTEKEDFKLHVYGNINSHEVEKTKHFRTQESTSSVFSDIEGCYTVQRLTLYQRLWC